MNHKPDESSSSESSLKTTTYSFDDDSSFTSEESSVQDDILSESTQPTAWFVKNYMNINPRAYYGQFEIGNFNYYDSHALHNSNYVRPFLPKDVRYLLLNQRVILLSHDNINPRCLHFPVQEDECKIILKICRHLYNKGKSMNQFVFAMRNASLALPGRVSFDIPRILKDLSENNIKIDKNEVGIFAVEPNRPAEIKEQMTYLSLPINPQLGETRKVALNNRIIAISSDNIIQIIDTENNKCQKYPIPDIISICSVPTGDFLTCTKSGFIHEFVKKENFDESIIYQVTNIDDKIGDFKVSEGGERSYAAANTKKTIIYSGIGEEFYEITFNKEFVDFVINNDDIYVATQHNTIEYYQYGQQFATWKSPSNITSLTIEPMSLSVGICACQKCYILDARTPSIIGLANFETMNPLSLHFSPFLDLSVVITDQGFSTFDIRQSNHVLSSVKVASRHEKLSNIKGDWMPESRLFSLAFKDSFLITCPYLGSPVLESYQIPFNDLISIHTNLQLNVIQQQNSITFIGGYGYPFHVPTVI